MSLFGKKNPKPDKVEKGEKPERINDATKFVADLALNFVEPKVERLFKEESISKELVLSLFPATKEVLVVLNDDNGDNKGQLAIVLRYWLHKKVLESLSKHTKTLIEGVDNSAFEASLMLLSKVAFDVLKLYTDEVPKDKEQVAKYFKGLALDPGFRDFVIDVLIPEVMKLAKAEDPLIRLVQGIVKKLWEQISYLDPETVLMPKARLTLAEFVGDDAEEEVQEP